ncbi:MAG: glycosyltransferase [Acidimicrobiia bacterium]
MNAPVPEPFTVVVVVYHRSDPLRRLLTGICADPVQSRPRFVVVNLEDDPDVRAVAEEFGATVVVAPDRGYAAAVNRGALEVTDEITVFACDDLEVDATSLRRLVDTVSNGTADVAVPQILDLAGNEEASIRALPTPGKILVEWALTSDGARPGARRIQKWRRPRVTEPIDAFDAALVAVHTEVLQRYPLPEDYFLYWEEIDWCWQLRDAGQRAVLVPDAVVRHAGGRDDVRAEKQRLLARNAVRCVFRTQGRAAAVLAWPIVVLWQVRLLMVDGLRALRGGTNRMPARAAGVGAAIAAWREFA